MQLYKAFINIILILDTIDAFLRGGVEGGQGVEGGVHALNGLLAALPLAVAAGRTQPVGRRLNREIYVSTWRRYVS